MGKTSANFTPVTSNPVAQAIFLYLCMYVYVYV